MKQANEEIFNDQFRNTELSIITKWEAVSTDNVEALRKILDKATNEELNQLNEKKLHIIHFATEKNAINCLRYLIHNKKVDVNLESENNMTYHRALHIAADSGYVEAIEELVKGGANLSLLDRNGHSALYVAASRYHAATVRELLKSGADPLFSDDNGWTALHTAACRGATLVVKELLDGGANPLAMSEKGSTALSFADNFEFKDIVFLLKYYPSLRVTEEGYDKQLEEALPYIVRRYPDKKYREDVFKIFLNFTTSLDQVTKLINKEGAVKEAVENVIYNHIETADFSKFTLEHVEYSKLYYLYQKFVEDEPNGRLALLGLEKNVDSFLKNHFSAFASLSKDLSINQDLKIKVTDDNEVSLTLPIPAKITREFFSHDTLYNWMTAGYKAEHDKAERDKAELLQPRNSVDASELMGNLEGIAELT